LSEEDEEWKKEAKKYEDVCIDLSDKLHIPVEKKEQFVKSCEIHAVKTGKLPSLENYSEWESEFKE
jgi:hypothetical protein